MSQTAGTADNGGTTQQEAQGTPGTTAPQAPPATTAPAPNPGSPPSAAKPTDTTQAGTSTANAAGALEDLTLEDEVSELQNGGKIVLTPEQLKERLNRTRTQVRAQLEAQAREREAAAEAERAKQAQAAKDAALAEQQQFRQLADQRGERILALEGEVATLKQQVAAGEPYKTVVGTYLTKEYEGLPQPIIDLLKERPAVDQLAWIAKNKATVQAQATAQAGQNGDTGTATANPEASGTPPQNGTPPAGGQNGAANGRTGAQQQVPIPGTPRSDGSGQVPSQHELERARQEFRQATRGRF